MAVRPWRSVCSTGAPGAEKAHRGRNPQNPPGSAVPRDSPAVHRPRNQRSPPAHRVGRWPEQKHAPKPNTKRLHRQSGQTALRNAPQRGAWKAGQRPFETLDGARLLLLSAASDALHRPDRQMVPHAPAKHYHGTSALGSATHVTQGAGIPKFAPAPPPPPTTFKRQVHAAMGMWHGTDAGCEGLGPGGMLRSGWNMRAFSRSREWAGVWIPVQSARPAPSPRCFVWGRGGGSGIGYCCTRRSLASGRVVVRGSDRQRVCGGPCRPLAIRRPATPNACAPDPCALRGRIRSLPWTSSAAGG